MSEQKLEPDIVERLKRYDGLQGDDDVVLVSIKVLRSAVTEIIRLRAERPGAGWRGAIEQIWTFSEDGTLTPHTRLAQIRRIAADLRALIPPAPGKGEGSR